jgi:alanine dehydrogenase
LIPYLKRLTSADWRSDTVLTAAVNLSEGEIVYPALREQYL